MTISKNKVVGIDYTLTDSKGNVIDSSKDHGALYYIQGIGNLIPGLEAKLEGKTKGDNVKAVIAPKDGYGEREDSLCQEVPRAQFENGSEIEVGMQFEVDTEQGELVVTVTSVSAEMITVDGNHPLAGVELHFDVTVKEVREATAEELSHGHVHGPDGHHHH
jgi:FKBP-type peptidyl-prolyl cis-trans isomerase SlyD